jgi:hypothetical protein
VREFLRESTQIVLNVDFWTVSLIDLLPDSGDLNSVAYWLRRAENALLAESFHDCLIYCRHAIYLEFVAPYDISPYANPDHKPGIGTFISSAPSWALTRDYIQNRVNNLCEFVVLNHDDLHRKLWEYGIDATTFWNLRRLTPDVFLPRENNSAFISGEHARDESLWVVKFEFDIFDSEGIEDRAAYVLRHTIETYSVRGLEGDELFWDIFWIEPGKEFFFGFVGGHDVERNERIADPGAFLRTVGVTRPS